MPTSYLIDAKGKVLGRLATRVAVLLTGKHKPTFAPHRDDSDRVVVVNAAAVRVTGNKLKLKQYKRFTGYPSGLFFRSLETVLEKRPEDVIRHAVRGMLPKNKLQARRLRRLRVYRGEHAEQGPLEKVE